MNIDHAVSDPIWLLDYDGTMYEGGYAAKNGTETQVMRNIATFLARLYKISEQKGEDRSNYYYREYGSTAAGLKIVDDINPREFLKWIHDPVRVDHRAELKEEPELRNTLMTLPGKKYIFTNALADYAKEGLDIMGLTACFSGMFGLFETGLISKPDIRAYEAVCNILASGSEAVRDWPLQSLTSKRLVIMVDDRKNNVEKAVEVGMYGVICHTDEPAGHDRVNMMARDLPRVYDAAVKWFRQRQRTD